MREIKFRAWNKVGKYYVNNVQDAYDGAGPNGPFDGFGDALDDDNYVVEQFTGLKDVNGKDIYEGDILHFGSVWCVGDEYDPREEEHIGAVEYRQDCASYVVNCNGTIFPLDGLISFDGYSVQGNVHTNPELLEEDEWLNK